MAVQNAKDFTRSRAMCTN